MSKFSNQTRRFIKRYQNHKMAVFSFYLLIALTLLAFLGPLFLPYTPYEITDQFLAPPSFTHILGTDAIGRDIFARLLQGMRISITVGVLSTLLATILAILLGSLAGYFGGWVDRIIMRVIEIVMSFPYILLILVFGLIFQPGMWSIIIILGFVNWPSGARLIRGSILSIKEKEYIQASRIAKMPSSYILFKELLPNAIAPILVFSSNIMAYSIIDEAALSFLGMGVQLPDASLGNMLNQTQSISVLTLQPWVWLPPGIAIVLLVLSMNFIGDGLRDALDPKSLQN